MLNKSEGGTFFLAAYPPISFTKGNCTMRYTPEYGFY